MRLISAWTAADQSVSSCLSLTVSFQCPTGFQPDTMLELAASAVLSRTSMTSTNDRPCNIRYARVMCFYSADANKKALHIKWVVSPCKNMLCSRLQKASTHHTATRPCAPSSGNDNNILLQARPSQQLCTTCQNPLEPQTPSFNTTLPSIPLPLSHTHTQGKSPTDQPPPPHPGCNNPQSTALLCY